MNRALGRGRPGAHRTRWGLLFAGVLLLVCTVLVPIRGAGPAGAAPACSPDPTVDAPVLTPLDTNLPAGSVTYGERVRVQTTVHVACAVAASLPVTQTLSSGLVWLADSGGLVGVSSSSTGFGSPDPLAGVLTSSNPVTASILTVTIPPVTPTGTLPVTPAATIVLTAVAIVAHPASGPFTDQATVGPSTATSAGLVLVSPPTTYTMAKTANPTLNVPAGTDVAYAITATPTPPTNPAPAYGVTITDTLPSGFTLDKSTDLASAVTDNSAAGCAGTMATPTLVGQILTISWAGPVPASCALSVAYSGVFAASASVTSVNTANLHDQSQPGAGSQSIVTGAGDTTPAVFQSGPASASVCTAAPTFGSAAVHISTNQPAIPAPKVTVGEEVSFTVTVNIPCAVNATVVETLDPGLVWLATSASGTLVPADASSSGTNLPATPDPTKFMQTAFVQPGGDGTILKIPFGGLTPSGAGAIITLTASALVEDAATVTNGSALNDSFSLNWGAANPATKTATVNVVEPDLTSFTKTASASVVSQPPNPPVNYSLAANFAASGSPAYAMTLKDALTPDLTIQSMTDTTTPPACRAADGLTLPTTAPFPSSATGGITLQPQPLPTVATGDCQLSIAYSGQFAANAAINQTNSATLTYQSLDSSLAKTSAATPTGVSTAPRAYNDAKSQTTTQVNSASVAASYTLASPNVSVGQKVPIALAIALPKGGAQGVTVTYALPAGMAFASVGGNLAGLAETLNGAPVAPAPGPVALTTPAQSITLSLGKVTAAGPGGFPALTIAFDAIVLDTSPPPTTITGGGATLTFCDPSLTTCPSPNPLTTPSGSPGALTVVTPILVEATQVAPSAVQPGDPITFTISLEHDPSSSGDAHDVTVTIPLGGWTLQGQCTEVDNLGAMAPCSQDASGNVTVHYNDHVVNGSLVAAIPTAPAPGAPAAAAMFTFTAAAPGTTPPSGQVTTTWESAPSLANQGLDAPQVNDQAHPHTSTLHGGDFSVGVTAPKVTKSVSDPNLPGGNATIGDKVLYTVTFTLPHLAGTSHGLTLTDTLGPGLAFADSPAPTSPCGSGPVAGTVTAGDPLLVKTSLPAFSCALAAANVQLTKPGDPASGSKLVLSLGDVTNADTTTTDETITFSYTAIVLDTPTNVGATTNSPATQVTNSVAMAYVDDAGVAQPASSQVSTLTIVEPSLTLDDQAQPLPADAGVNGPNLAGVRYQMTVTNASTLATAYNVVISQDIPSGLTLDPVTSLCNAAFVTPPSTAAVPTPVTCTAVPIGSANTQGFHLHASAIGLLQPGQQIVFSYTIDVIPGFFPAAISLPPTAATVDWTSQSGPPVSLTSNGPPGPAGSTYAKQRTGKTNPPPTVSPAPIVGVDNYETPGSSVVTLTLAALSLAAASPASAPLGSEVTMSATITLPEAFTAPAPAARKLSGFDLQATLPSGLCYEAGSLTAAVAANITTHVPTDATLNTTPCKAPAVAGAAVPAPIPGATNVDFRFGCAPAANPVLPCTGETDVNPVTATPAPADANTVKLTWTVIVLANPGSPTAPGVLSTPASLLLDGHAPIVGTPIAVKVLEPQLKVTTAWGVSQGEPNQTAPASVTIMNTGSSAANNIAATFGFTNATPPSDVTVGGASGTCGSPVPTAGGISVSVGTLAAGASVVCAFSPTIQLPAVIAAGAKATLAASVTTTTLDDAANPYNRVEAPVTQQSDLLISLTTISLAGTMTPVGDPFKPGGPAKFTLTISNNSPPGSANSTTNAIGIDVQSAALPGLVLSPNVGDIAPAAALTWNAFTLAPGSSVTATVNGTVPASAPPGPVTVTATITPVAAVNTGASSIVGTATVQPAVDLATSLTITAPFVAGVQGTYVMSVTNKGPSAAGAITLTDTLPAGISFVSAKGTGWTCKAGVTCASAGLAAGATTTVSLTVLVDLPTGAQVNNAFNATTANDVNSANNLATNQTTVQPSSAGAAGHGSSVLTGTSSSGEASASSGTAAALATTGAYLGEEALLALVLFGIGSILALAPARRRRRRSRAALAPADWAAMPPPAVDVVAPTAETVVAGSMARTTRSRLRRWLVAFGLATLVAFLLGRGRPGPGY